PHGRTVAELPNHQDAVEAIAFDGRGQLLATGSRDRSVSLWRRDGDDVRLVFTLQRLPAAVRSLWLHADGSQLAVLLHNESAVRVWDLERLRRRCQEMDLGW